MKPNPAFSLFMALVIINMVACYNPDHSSQLKNKIPDSLIKTKQSSVPDSDNQATHVYTKGDSSCVIVNNQTLCISKKYPIDLANTFPFICQVKNGVIEKRNWLRLGSLTLLSIDQRTGRGYTELYAIDNKTKTLLKDPKFKLDYLLGYGIFFVNGNKIFTMHKYYYNEKYDMRSSGSLYMIKNDKFIYIKSRVEKDGISQDDTAIVNFSQRPLNKKY